jgi:hypothetical protein
VLFPSGFKGNLVDMLAAMRLLNIKQEFIRKRSFTSESKKSVVSFNSLQESFNNATGLKNVSEASFIIKFIKATLSSCIKLHNKGFPGGWINSSRRSNGVKSDFALINILGWTEKVPSNHKLVETIFNTVDLTSTKPPTGKVVNLTQDRRNFSHQEFRTAVALVLPRVDSTNPKSFEDMVKLDPLSVKSLTICNNFVLDGRLPLVNSLNECYALKVSLKNPKSKTKEIHYKISRDRMLGLSANIPLIDSKGVKYDTFGDIPENFQKVLREKYRFPTKRREIEETVLQDGEEQNMNIDAIEASTEPPSGKKRKITKGQAQEALRRSGRLHRSSATKK